ncbi:DsbA family oxidoreductase [Chryseobacterium sp. C39-AII1]|uniref:DsbA family oxidoreductase n=1 Tax=Chryseobacterium sp. C39-AII1 TaxID=3080332 RepID=UPI00320AF1F4
MKIEVWSDVMCPFCYIGKHNFEQALEKLPFKDKVEVEWKSFQLDPTLESGKAISTSQYFKEKKGFPESQAQQMMNHVSEVGKSAGLEFNFSKALITNTFSAHKILHLAKKYSKANEMEELLFKAHFTDGKDVSDVDVLSSLASELGINEEETKKVLSSDEFDYEVNQDILEARNHGISSVPFFVLNEKYAVSGAQPVNVFEDALRQTFKETESPFINLSDQGNSCDDDGCTI